MLNERKKKILRAVIEDYINNAEPIGSKTLLENYDLDVSSATIRNEMAELEEMGYLDKPHTSAGRVPSTLGYRFYVDSLMQTNELNIDEISLIKRNVEGEILEVSEIIKHVTKAVSNITNYTVISTGPNVKDDTIKDIKLVLLSSNTLLLVVMTNNEAIKETILRLDKEISEDVIAKLNNILLVKLKGVYVKDVDKNVIEYVENELLSYLDILIRILNEIYNLVENKEFMLDGTNNIFKHPEFKKHDLAKCFLDTLETKTVMQEILEVSPEDINVYIGDENKHLEFKDFSVVTYKCPNNLGIVGIIGPKRMNYSKVVSVIKYINKLFKEKYTKGGNIGE